VHGLVADDDHAFALRAGHGHEHGDRSRAWGECDSFAACGALPGFTVDPAHTSPSPALRSSGQAERRDLQPHRSARPRGWRSTRHAAAPLPARLEPLEIPVGVN
jgi:hypothetical protein